MHRMRSRACLAGREQQNMQTRYWGRSVRSGYSSYKICETEKTSFADGGPHVVNYKL